MAPAVDAAGLAFGANIGWLARFPCGPSAGGGTAGGATTGGAGGGVYAALGGVAGLASAAGFVSPPAGFASVAGLASPPAGFASGVMGAVADALTALSFGKGVMEPTPFNLFGSD